MFIAYIALPRFQRILQSGTLVTTDPVKAVKLHLLQNGGVPEAPFDIYHPVIRFKHRMEPMDVPVYLYSVTGEKEDFIVDAQANAPYKFRDMYRTRTTFSLDLCRFHPSWRSALRWAIGPEIRVQSTQVDR